MTELDRQEMYELLLGTWTGVALVAEILIERELICRDDLLCVFAQAEAEARDRRGTAIVGIRMLMELGFGLGAAKH